MKFIYFYAINIKRFIFLFSTTYIGKIKDIRHLNFLEGADKLVV